MSVLGRKIFTEDECASIASFLRTAAGSFKHFAETSLELKNEQLSAQFLFQETQASYFANLFTDADSAEIVYREEEDESCPF